MASKVETKAQHTPGQWVLTRGMALNEWSIETEHRYVGRFTASVMAANGGETYARLIGAAPDLLAQLENTLTTLALMADAYSHGSATRNTLEAECNAIRAAIAKATA